MSTMTPRKIITELGFDRPAVFQAAWNLGPKLLEDDIVGPVTSAAAVESWVRHERGRPDISPHFSAGEFRCKCGGRYRTCRGVLVTRGLLTSLEALRLLAYQDGLPIVSGYRCEKHNAAVQGAAGSQHLYGRAADVPGVLRIEAARSRRLFSGLGYVAATRLVVHVDVRPGASVSTPVTWAY